MSSQRVEVCKVDDLREGQMRQVNAAGHNILLARRGDRFWAIAAHCSHYGAPLEKGVLSEGRVVCPWHNACFSLESGELLEPPGRNNLKAYTVETEADSVYIEVPVSQIKIRSGVMVEDSASQSSQVVPKSATYLPQEDDRTFAIVGGGAAGNAAAEVLRQSGFQGRLVLLSADSDPPYDRTELSKSYLQQHSGNDPDLLRSQDFYQRRGIDIKTNAPVNNLDVTAKQLTYRSTEGSDETISYDALLLATGGSVQQLPIPGADLQNIFTLRRAEDAQHILEVAQDAQRAVVIGAGFIGMEVAASLSQQDLDVTVVALDTVPFEKVLGQAVGRLFQQVHESNGVTFKLGTKASTFHGETSVEAVELETGETIPADIVVVGIGVKPATQFIEGLELDDDGSVRVDEYLQAAPSVFAAGDIAKYPDFIAGEPIRVEHWRLALQQGRVAAHNMLGQSEPFHAVPFFWTGQFNLKLRYVGHAEAWDEVVIHGSLDDHSFLAFYVKGDQILAIAGIGRDRDIAAISELMRLKQMPTASQLKQQDIDWIEMLTP